jgi:hypothetical protein
VREETSKTFFFEKKKQKTFTMGGLADAAPVAGLGARATGHADHSFFSKTIQ